MKEESRNKKMVIDVRTALIYLPHTGTKYSKRKSIRMIQGWQP